MRGPLPATSSTRNLNPLFVSEEASNDVASNIREALVRGTANVVVTVFSVSAIFIILAATVACVVAMGWTLVGRCRLNR